MLCCVVFKKKQQHIIIYYYICLCFISVFIDLFTTKKRGWKVITAPVADLTAGTSSPQVTDTVSTLLYHYSAFDLAVCTISPTQHLHFSCTAAGNPPRSSAMRAPGGEKIYIFIIYQMHPTRHKNTRWSWWRHWLTNSSAVIWFVLAQTNVCINQAKKNDTFQSFSFQKKKKDK